MNKLVKRINLYMKEENSKQMNLKTQMYFDIFLN